MQSTPQQEGRAFEDRFADALGVKPVKASGALWWAKQDIADGQILWSLKWTGRKTLTITGAIIRDVVNAVFGLAGVGPRTIPAVATDVDGEVYVIMRASDFRRMLLEDRKYVVPSKDEQRRANASIPALLRESED